MIIDRREFTIKPGHLHEALDLLADISRQAGEEIPPYQVYHPITGSFNRIVIDFEFESVAACEAFWADWPTTPEATDFLKQWSPLEQEPGRRELLSRLEFTE